MTVVVAQDADVIAIRVRDATPEGAVDLAHAVGTAYERFVINQSSQAAAAGIKQLDKSANELKVELDRIAVALQADANNQILQARQGAIREQLNATIGQRERLAAQARNPVSPVLLQEPAAPPQQPVQPSPRRSAMAGLLLGLVGSTALAWWLNSRAVKQQQAQQERRAGGWAWRREQAEWNKESNLEQEAAAERMDTVPAVGEDTQPGAVAPLGRPRDIKASLQQDAETMSALDGRLTAAAVPAANGGEGLRSVFDRLEGTLYGESLAWYLDNYPQVMAEQLTMSVSTEMVAVLLDNDEGSLVVAGGFGLTAEEQAAVVRKSHDVLRQALADGVGIFQEGIDRMPTAAAGLPGSQSTKALMIVPLVKRSSWFGMLAVGRRSANGHRVAGFNDQEIERIIMYAMEIAPTLHTLILLGRLQDSLRSPEQSRDDGAELPLMDDAIGN